MKNNYVYNVSEIYLILMITYRIFSQIIKNYTKTIKNVNINKYKKRNNKEPPINISIMDTNYSKQFWKMHETSKNQKNA